MIRKQMLLYAITANIAGIPVCEFVEQAILGGATLIQFREKRLKGAELLAAARAVKQACEKGGVPMIVNDSVELAIECGADGVHLGQSDMPASRARQILGNRIIGVTARTPELAIAAQNAGADYIGSGAVFGTLTKKDALKLDISILKEICASVNIPVVAIGGIDENNITQLKGTGVAGFAVVSAIFGAKDVQKATQDLLALARQSVGE